MVLINVLALVLLVVATWKLRVMIAWVVLGVFLALTFEPAVGWLTRHRWKRGWAVLAVFGLSLVLFGGLIAAFVPMLTAQARELFARGPELLERALDLPPIRWADEQFGIVEKARTSVGDQAGNAAQPALALVGGVVHAITGAITIIALAVFSLLFGEQVFDSALRWLPLERRARAKHLAVRMSKVVSGYVAGTAVIATIGGVVIGVTLAILGVPYFVPLAVLMTIFGVVPILGTTIAAVVIVGATFATSGSTAALICLGVYLVYQQIENHLLQPVVNTRTLKMNPLIIVLALLVGTGLVGVLGALLALPIAGAVQVLLEDVLAQREERAAAAARSEVEGLEPDVLPSEELKAPWGEAGPVRPASRDPERIGHTSDM